VAENKPFAVAAGICSGLGLGAWGFYFRALTGAREEDWMVYYTAIRTYFDAKLSLLYDGAALTARMNALFAGWLTHPLPLHPWLYPPHYLLLLLPLGLLPPAAGLVLFLGGGLAALLAALMSFFAEPRRRLIAILMVLLCPASAITVFLGQNTFLTCALFVGGFALLGRQPVLAGALLSVLTYKPQFFLLVPVALLAGRQWKAIAAAAATAAVLCLASVALFGFDPWRDWLRVMTEPSALFVQWTTLARLNGQSVFTYASLLGAPHGLANALQACAAVFAAAAVWAAYRSALPPQRKLAVLLAATMLAAPHVIDYDALMLGLAAALLLEEPSLAETILLGLLWVSPFFNPPSVWPLAYATPPLVVTLILWVLRRPRSQTAWVWL
jgi:alpha-1,2-mannosyltransferase